MNTVLNNPLEKVVDLEKVQISLIEKGIVLNSIKLGKLIEAEDVYQIRNINLDLVNHEPYGVLVESDELTSFSKEARELAASQEIECNSAAKALYIKSLGQRIVANFYLKLNKPFVKTKVFEDKEEAFEWIRQEVALEKLIRNQNHF